MLMLHGVGSAVGPAIAGWLMAGSATLLPLYFLAMFSACGLYSLWSWYHTRDRIVAAAARQVSMAHTVSAEALEMVVDEQKPDEEAGDPEVARWAVTDARLGGSGKWRWCRCPRCRRSAAARRKGSLRH